jgi:23S rRNA (adenine2503-C2)-methyltransferase
MKTGIKSLTRDELAATLTGWALPAYRVDQVLEWIYRQRAATWDEMTNLPRALRERLAGQFDLNPQALMRVQGARDTTAKLLWRLGDGSFIESVLIPANPALYGEGSDRHTLCISTQVGCAYGCKFCASGLKGWKRNLTPDEMVEQILAVERWGRASLRAEDLNSDAPESAAQPVGSRVVDNLVVMGMGEPLANYDNLLKALRILNAPWGGGIGARKITVSTSGLVPQIRQLADEPLQFQLAVSLHGATDEVRSRIMPVNRKYPVAELVAACEYFVSQKGRMITLEYILIAGINEALEQAEHLAALARRLRAKVNLIPYNPVEGLPWSRPPEDQCEAFCAVLERRGIPATLRREKGGDIDAACGQLRLRVENELAAAPAGGGA